MYNVFLQENISNDEIGSTSLADSEIKNKTKSVIERSIEIPDPKDTNKETTIYNSRAFSSAEFAVENVSDYPGNPQNASNEATFNNERFTAVRHVNISKIERR
jgi:hypothetical protein